MTTRVVHLRSAAWAQTPPANRVRIDRRTRWGNTYRIGPDGDRSQVIADYRVWLRQRPELVTAARVELRGKTLGCWCAPLPCHGDLLAAVADGAEP